MPAAPANLPAQRVSGASTSHGAHISAIARSRNACGRSAAGKRRGGRPNAARTTCVKARHAQAEKERRQRAKLASQIVEGPEVKPERGHAAEPFFSLPLCDRPGCHESPVNSLRNPARYCCPACRQAVRNVQDRERKWSLVAPWTAGRNGFFEYRAASERRLLQQANITKSLPLRVPPA